MIINIKRTFTLIITGTILLAYINSQAATITATTDRNPVGLNESFMLTFESDSSVDSEPDFSPLNKEFQILSRNSKRSMSILNGKFSTSKKWQLTVLARRAGKLIIPVINFGKDRSQASFINVSTGRSSPSSSKGSRDIFIEVEAEPKSPYVQAEVIYTVRLFLSVATSNASLSEPGISGANVVIERLGEDSNFQINRRGKRYNVVERKYAIYPQLSGTMTIGPVMFQGQINRNAFSLFDPFGPQPKTVIERSMSITLDVESVPDQFPGGHWIPAKKLVLTESWSQDPPVFQVGEPLTRTLSMVALGQTASQLPELPDWVPDDFKQYPDQPSLNDSNNNKGIKASRQEKVAIIPNKAGEYVLPEISVPWWNTNTNKLEYARIPERKISVDGFINNADTDLPPMPTLDAPVSVAEAYNDRVSDEISKTGSGFSTGFWRGLSAGLALAWLITLAFWWRSRVGKKDVISQGNKAAQLKQAIKSVKQACHEGGPDKLKQALIIWGQQVWPDSPATSLGEIGKRSPEDLAEKIAQLNYSLYSQQKDPWDGDSFWQVFKSSLASSARQQDRDTGDLEPLYRI